MDGSALSMTSPEKMIRPVTSAERRVCADAEEVALAPTIGVFVAVGRDNTGDTDTGGLVAALFGVEEPRLQAAPRSRTSATNGPTTRRAMTILPRTVESLLALTMTATR